jgi:hypothetical protein
MSPLAPVVPMQGSSIDWADGTAHWHPEDERNESIADPLPY